MSNRIDSSRSAAPKLDSHDDDLAQKKAASLVKETKATRSLLKTATDALISGLGHQKPSRPDDSPWKHAYDGVDVVVNAPLGLAAHFFGDTRMAESTGGHLAASAAKTAADTATGLARKGVLESAKKQLLELADKASRQPNPDLDKVKALRVRAERVPVVAKQLNIISTLSDLAAVVLPKNAATELVTSVTKFLDPQSQINAASGAAVDGTTTLGQYATGNHAAAFRSAEKIEDNAIRAKYGPWPSAATGAVALATGDREVEDKFTGRRAEQGEYGVFVAYGNCVADSIMGRTPEADRGGAWTTTDEALREVRELRWYKPWTW